MDLLALVQAVAIALTAVVVLTALRLRTELAFVEETEEAPVHTS